MHFMLYSVRSHTSSIEDTTQPSLFETVVLESLSHPKSGSHCSICIAPEILDVLKPCRPPQYEAQMIANQM